MNRNIEKDLFNTEDPKKTINQRTKGQKNERDLCKVLEKWTGEQFARIPASGGLRWKNTANITGDVLCTNTEFFFPFSIETKHLKKLTITKTLRANSEIFSIWQQAERDGERSNKIPILMLRENGMVKNSYYVFLDAKLYLLLSPEVRKKVVSKGVKSLENTLSVQVLYGFKSEDFLAINFLDLIDQVKENYINLCKSTISK